MAFLVGLPLLGSCTGLYARGYGGYMQPKLTGSLGLAVTDGSQVSGENNVQSDLGLGTGSSPYARIDLGTSLASATFSGFQYDSTGTGTTSAAFGGNIPAGTSVRTQLKLTNVKGAATFNLLDVGFLRIAPGVAVDYLNLDSTLTATGSSAFERLRVEVPAPMLYLQTEARLGPLRAMVDVGGLKANLSDISGTWYDVDGMLAWQPIRHVEVFGGYRLIRFDANGVANGRNFIADITLQGWFAGGGLTF